MDDDSIVVRDPALMSAPVDDDLVILVPSSDNYVAFDAVGRAIWERIGDPVRVGALVEQLAAAFSGPAESIRTDVLGFLGELQREGMITVS